MRLSFFLFIIFFTKIYLKEEGKPQSKDNDTVKEIEKEYNEDEGYYPGNKIYDLNDLIFDLMIREGRIYRWFVIFYSKTCGHCRKAKKEISKLFNDLKDEETLRFAQMEAYDNTLTNVRFNITGVPYIILIENNSILELDLFPNYDNLKNFVLTNFSDVQDELKPLPKKVKFHYVAWVIFKQTLDSITGGFNNFLKRKGINIQFNGLTFILTVLTTIILCCTGLVKCCMYCCCNDEDIARELKMLEEQYNQEMEKRKKEGLTEEDENNNDEGEEGEELEGEEEEEDDEEGEEEEDDVEENEKKEMTEEEKKKMEEEKKEEEMKKKEEEMKQKEEEKKKKEEEEKKKREEEEEKKKTDKNKKKKKKKKD